MSDFRASSLLFRQIRNIHIMRKQLLTFALLLSLWIPLSAQITPAATEAEFDKSYEWRIRQERLFGVFIPADIAGVFAQLTGLSDAKDRAKFKALSEDQAATVPFFSLGRWMSVNWGFYGGSRLTVYLNQLGLYHPEDMTRFLLIMYNRHLNKKDLAPKEVIEGLIAARKSYDQKQQLRGDVIEENTRQLEKPDEGQ